VSIDSDKKSFMEHDSLRLIDGWRKVLNYANQMDLLKEERTLEILRKATHIDLCNSHTFIKMDDLLRTQCSLSLFRTKKSSEKSIEDSATKFYDDNNA
jgi:hypothetical protein